MIEVHKRSTIYHSDPVYTKPLFKAILLITNDLEMFLSKSDIIIQEKLASARSQRSQFIKQRLNQNMGFAWKQVTEASIHF